MYASNYHTYTHLILALGIVRKPTIWGFITLHYPGIHDIGLLNKVGPTDIANSIIQFVELFTTDVSRSIAGDYSSVKYNRQHDRRTEIHPELQTTGRDAFITTNIKVGAVRCPLHGSLIRTHARTPRTHSPAGPPPLTAFLTFISRQRYILKY